MAYWRVTPFAKGHNSLISQSPMWVGERQRAPQISGSASTKEAAVRFRYVVKTTTYYKIFLRGNNQHLSGLDILHLKDITDGISGKYSSTYGWEFKYVSHPMPSPYIDSSMDVVIFLSWRGANSEYVLRLYGIHVELCAKHMIPDLRRSSLLITFKL